VYSQEKISKKRPISIEKSENEETQINK